MVIIYVQASGIKGPQVPTSQQVSEQDHKQAERFAYVTDLPPFLWKTA